MIDIEKETLLSLTEAARACPPIDGKRVHPSTIFRWMSAGIRGGVRLEHVRVGRRLCTTKAALGRFFQDLAETAPSHSLCTARKPRAGRTATKRNADVAQAMLDLEAAGIKTGSIG